MGAATFARQELDRRPPFWPSRGIRGRERRRALACGMMPRFGRVVFIVSGEKFLSLTSLFQSIFA